MKFERIKPPEHLKSHIRYFWKLESDVEDTSPKTFRIIADGCPGIIIHKPENGEFYQNDKKMPALCLYGQSTKSAKLVSNGKLSAIGVFLKPNTLRTVFGLNADELTNTCIDLDLSSKSKDFLLLEKLSETVSDAMRIDVLSTYLNEQFKSSNSEIDDSINNALSEILETNGNVSLKDLQKDLGLSEKSLQRKFKKTIGMPPKLYARICRFQASLNQLREKDFLKLSDIAYDNDYSDQSHFIRSFRQFTGFSPNQFYKQSHEVVENLSAVK